MASKPPFKQALALVIWPAAISGVVSVVVVLIPIIDKFWDEKKATSQQSSVSSQTLPALPGGSIEQDSSGKCSPNVVNMIGGVVQCKE